MIYLRIKTTKSFDKEIKRLGKHYASIANDYAALLDELAQNPRLGIDLGSGLRKIRMQITSKGKGKSGGARVITFTVMYRWKKAKLISFISMIKRIVPPSAHTK